MVLEGEALLPGYAVSNPMEAVLAQLYDNYRPSSQGVCAVLPETRVTLPVPYWGGVLHPGTGRGDLYRWVD